ncbi:MAG: cobalt-precorrin 5A hydrolase [Candidatus Ornithomonoglobus sp.]
MNISIISFTANGDALNERISDCFADDTVHQTGKYLNPKSCSLSEWTGEAFGKSELIIFVGAAGIAVRAIAPYIVKKNTDPAVLAVDEGGSFVIPLLSGHIGGANAYATMLAERLGAQAVITTATDINGVFAVDTWAVNNGYAIDNTEEIKRISGALLDGQKVCLASDFKIKSELPEGIVKSEYGEIGICISDSMKKPFKHTLNLIPKRYVIGVGSKKNADEGALIELFDKLGINKKSVAAVATIDIKKNEKSVLGLAEYLGAELKLYTADALNLVSGDFTSSEFVKSITGTDNVCERAAALTGGRLIVKKTKGSGVTAAASVIDWSVSF